jgi:internalin A
MENSLVLQLIAQAAEEQKEEVNLSGMSLSKLPPELLKLTNLTSLHLSCNALTTLPEAISQLTKLSFLDLSNNEIDVLPESFGQLTKLISLDLSDNKIDFLSESFGQLTKLISLDLRNNQLKFLPDSIGYLINLTSFNLRNNQLKFLPDSIGHLINLTSFNLRNNQLKALPDSIGYLINLTFFNLSNNQLTALPEAIGKLNNLTSFDLSDNRLDTLPESIGQLTNLISLIIWNNQLNALPHSIGNLSKLTSLDLRISRLKTLPESFGQLNNLTSLNLSSNRINALPESFGELSNLKKLSLNNNHINNLPESIGKLTNLHFLNLSSNQLNDLPMTIGQLSQLNCFMINENPLIQIAPEIFNKGGLAVRDYYKQRLEEQTDYIYEAKLLIIGEGGAGKTSLAKKLIDPEYQLKLEGGNNPEKSTEGIDVLRFDFPHTSSHNFRINIWDFGGQEIYHATHQFFLTKRSLYLLVADTRQDNTDFNYWLEVIELLSESSPAIIVKNEKQERPCQVNENQLRGRFPNLEKILPTNLSSNRGLPEILTAVQHHISQLPHIGHPLPKTWVRVRAALEADLRNYITKTEFLDLCDTHGFKRHTDKLQLSGYLHDIGVCLHFQDDPILKNWIILKPEWGTTAVYNVLDTPKVQQAFGCFTHHDLAEIWSDDQYNEMRDELLQLMMRFKLCYEIPHRPRTYIAPQLLSPNQPEYPWDDTENLILRYHYEFMPKGMLTRFAVEMHKLIDNDLIWKDGIILADRYARAEIIETYYKKEIRIRISGKLKKRLLEKIRHEFEKIHSSYNKPEEPPENHRLRYQEFIPCNCPLCNGSQSPHAYALKNLEERMSNNRDEIECDISYEMVNVRNLIDDTIGRGHSTEPTNSDRYTEETSSPTTIIINAGKSTVENQSPKTQNFNAPMSGVIASDNALVIDNTFTQTNNANTAEILDLINTLRQTVTQFPAEIQESAIIDIEDLEIEVQKPADQRSRPRLKKSLIALFTAATLIAAPIAGITDFTNNVLEIGNKLHIELPKLP